MKRCSQIALGALLFAACNRPDAATPEMRGPAANTNATTTIELGKNI